MEPEMQSKANLAAADSSGVSGWRAAKAVLVFLLLLIPRLCIPVSFLLAFVFAPISMLLDLPNWPRRLVEMWEDPL